MVPSPGDERAQLMGYGVAGADSPLSEPPTGASAISPVGSLDSDRADPWRACGLSAAFSASCGGLGQQAEGAGLETFPLGGDRSPLTGDRLARRLTIGGPSALGLGLTGLLTLAGWQLVRWRPNLYLGDLPAWYHVPAGQVAHAVPFDLSSPQPTALPACWFERPGGDPPVLYQAACEACTHPAAQSFLVVTAPRGPPLLRP
jgi:hypothetical protein